MIQGHKILIKNEKQPSKAAELMVGQCLRTVPGRRMVYDGIFENQNVIIKVFLSRFHGRRHFQREMNGYEYLKLRDISTAEIVTHGRNSDGKWVLVLKKIDNAQDVHSLLAESNDNEHQKILIGKMLTLLAKMHRAGVLQQDLHSGNFLWDGNNVYALDPAQMQYYLGFANRIGRQKSLEQLALIATAFMNYNYDEKKELFNTYFEKRGWQLDKSVLEQIEILCHKARQGQIKRFLKKSLRTCTDFIREKYGLWQGVFNRQLFGNLNRDEFMASLDDAMEDGEILKRGNTCFVSRIQAAGKDIVVKRYNYKGLWHSLRHTFKGSRAKKCWLFGHRLRWLSVPVAEPLAYIELRYCGIIRQSYILNKYIDGQSVLDYVNQPDLDKEARQEARGKTYALLDQIAEHKITHGDLKASNILICDDQPVLIDLDSMKRHRCRWLLKLYQWKMQNKLKGQGL